jgi:hypothetical protein
MIRFINVKQEHSDNLNEYGIKHQFAFGQITVDINLSPQERINDVLVDMLKYLAGIGNRTKYELLDVTKMDSLINNIYNREAKNVTPKNVTNSFSMKAIASYLLKAHDTNSRQQLNRFSKKNNLHKYGTLPAITIARPEPEYSDDVAQHDGVFFNFSSTGESRKIIVERPSPLQHTLESVVDSDPQIKYLFDNIKELTDLQMIWFMTNIIDYKSARTVINQLKRRDGRIAVFYKIAKDMYPEPLAYSKVIGDGKFEFDYIHQAVNNPFAKPYKVLESPRTYTQEEQSKRLQEVFDKILDDPEITIHCVKVDAGTGKTRVMLEDFLSYNMAYLAPTHKLLLQSLNDLRKFNPMLWEKTVYIPKIDDEELPECDKKFDLLRARRIGDHKKVSQLQREIIKERGNMKLKKKLEQYEKAMKAKEGVPFITFQRFLSTHMFYKKFQNVDTFVIDEDIVKLVFPNYEHSDGFVISELDKMAKFAVEHYDLKEEGFGAQEELDPHKEKLLELVKEIGNIIKMIRQNEIVSVNSSQDFFCSNHKIVLSLIRKMIASGKKIKMNYFNILESEMFIKKNHGKATKFYHNNSKMLRGKKLIIMSATLDKEVHVPLLAKLINPSVRFHDLGRTKLKGNLYQYADFSTTKFSLKNKEERTKLISKVLPKLNVENVITYKDGKKDFGYVTEQMHFYNSAGYNDLSGKDIAVIGTPNGQPEDVVALGYLITKELPKSYIGNTLVFKSQSMFKDEWKLPFYTFSHKDDGFFRRLHLWSTYNELVQAVGRARQTRHENNCYVFSQLPLPQAKIKSYSEVV